MKQIKGAELDKKDWRFTLSRLYTSGLGLGFLPKAPGTFGSLPGLALGAWLHTISLSLAILILFVLGWLSIVAIQSVEKRLDAHDPSEIVIDEVLGQAIAVLFLTPNSIGLATAFVLFRLFDIWKPGPIGWVDRNIPKAFGTMADDLVAGIIAGVLARITLSAFSLT